MNNTIAIRKYDNYIANLELDRLIFYLILFLPCANSFFTLFSIDIVLYYYCAIAFLLIINAILQRGEYSLIIKIICLFALVVYNFLAYGTYYVTHSDFYGMFFLVTVLLFPIKVEHIKKYFFNSKTAVKCSTYLYIILLIASLFFGHGYDFFNSYSTYKVLFGAYNLSHTLAYELVFYLIINWVAFRFSIKNILILCALFICLLLTQVRTVYLAIVVIVLYELTSSKTLSVKQKIFAYLLIVALLISFIIIYETGSLSYIPFFAKTISAAENGSITSGRETYVDIAIKSFSNFSAFDKIFGVSLDGIRAIFLKEIGVDIHCHNDIFNLLLGYGIVGLAFILISLVPFIRTNNKIFFAIFLAVFIWYNGLYMYQNFTFLLIIIRGVYFQKSK